MSFLQMRATREYTACERQKGRKRERGLNDARETVLVSESLIKHQDNVVSNKWQEAAIYLHTEDESKWCSACSAQAS